MRDRPDKGRRQPFRDGISAASCTLTLALLAACQPATQGPQYAPETHAANPAASAASAPQTVTYRLVPAAQQKKGLALHGYNYTDLPISSYSVRGAWGGDIDVSSETTGGGKTTCCASVPTVLPRTYLVTWSRDDRRWCEKEVVFDGPIPDHPEFFNTHFFQDGHIEISITEEFTDLKVKLPNYRNGLSRHESGNVVVDEKVARCKDVR